MQPLVLRKPGRIKKIRRTFMSSTYVKRLFFLVMALFVALSNVEVVFAVNVPTDTNYFNWAPRAWPSDLQWIPYTVGGTEIMDKEVQDDSNGGLLRRVM